MRGLKFLILGLAVAAGVGAVALVRTELQRARDAANGAGLQEQAASQQAPKSKVLVAARDLGRGHPLKPEDLIWREWPEDLVAETYLTAQARPEAVQKAGEYMVKSAFVAGEPITEAKLIKINHPGVMSAMLRQGYRAVAIQITPEAGVGGFILPGDFVDVILTRKEDIETRRSDGSFREEEILITTTLIRTVRVLAIDTVFQTDDEATTAMKRTASLEVTPEMAELLALSEKAGRLTLALRSLAELVGPNGEIIDDPEPSIVFDIAALAGRSLPGQAATADVGQRAPNPAPPAPAPSPASSDEILMVRGAVKQSAPLP